MPGVSAGKVSSCDWWLETGDRGGESVTTHGDISEKMLVHVTGGHEKRKMTMDAFIQWWFKSDQYQSKVSKIGFQSWGLTKRLIKPLDFETNNQSKVNPSYFLISFISDCIIQCTYVLVAWRDQFDGGVRAKTKAGRWVSYNKHALLCIVYSWWSFRKLLTRIFLSCGLWVILALCAMCISMRSKCDNTRLESARSEADSEREWRGGREAR